MEGSAERNTALASTPGNSWFSQGLKLSQGNYFDDFTLYILYFFTHNDSSKEINKGKNREYFILIIFLGAGFNSLPRGCTV